jgi:hypothetical protein
MKILSAMGVKIIRTYNVHLPEAVNVLKTIKELRQENPEFEMYVMLGRGSTVKMRGLVLNQSQRSERNASEMAHRCRIGERISGNHQSDCRRK